MTAVITHFCDAGCDLGIRAHPTQQGVSIQLSLPQPTPGVLIYFLWSNCGGRPHSVLLHPCCDPQDKSNDHIPQILWRHRFCKGTGSCVRQGDRAAALLPSTVARTRSSAAAVESESSSHLTEMHRFICRHDIQGSLVPEWLPSVSGS